MALSELAAFESAYQVLQPLDPASRRRALQWLSDALGESKPLTRTTNNAAATGQSEIAQTAAAARPRRRAAQTADAARRGAKPVKKTPPRGRSRSEEPSHTGARTYRRMPAAEEVMAAYRQVGTVNGLAEHFDVPVHTAYSWARRLRGQGYQIGRPS